MMASNHLLLCFFLLLFAGHGLGQLVEALAPRMGVPSDFVESVDATTGGAESPSSTHTVDEIVFTNFPTLSVPTGAGITPPANNITSSGQFYGSVTGDDFEGHTFTTTVTTTSTITTTSTRTSTTPCSDAEVVTITPTITVTRESVTTSANMTSTPSRTVTDRSVTASTGNSVSPSITKTSEPKTVTLTVHSKSTPVPMVHSVSATGSKHSASASMTTVHSSSCRVVTAVTSTIPTVISGRTTVISSIVSVCVTNGISMTGGSSALGATHATAVTSSAHCALPPLCTAEVSLSGKQTRLTYLCPSATSLIATSVSVPAQPSFVVVTPSSTAIKSSSAVAEPWTTVTQHSTVTVMRTRTIRHSSSLVVFSNSNTAVDASKLWVTSSASKSAITRVAPSELQSKTWVATSSSQALWSNTTSTMLSTMSNSSIASVVMVTLSEIPLPTTTAAGVFFTRNSTIVNATSGYHLTSEEPSLTTQSPTTTSAKPSFPFVDVSGTIILGNRLHRRAYTTLVQTVTQDVVVTVVVSDTTVQATTTTTSVLKTSQTSSASTSPQSTSVSTVSQGSPTSTGPQSTSVSMVSHVTIATPATTTHVPSTSKDSYTASYSGATTKYLGNKGDAGRKASINVWFALIIVLTIGGLLV